MKTQFTSKNSNLPKGDARLPIIINHEGCDACDMIGLKDDPYNRPDGK